ncbi:MAG: PEGA domain-containing protein [Sandaracinaceae bacterium]
MRSVVVIALALGLAVPSARVAAQVPVLVDRDAPADRVAVWTARVRPEPARAIEEVRASHPVGTVAARRLAVLAEIEGALAIARSAAARLEEGVALSALSQASRLAESHLDIPGMASWYAEVQLAIALTATQAGLSSLGEAALARAASVDPTRGVLAAEARPEVVERARRAYRAVATAARGRFEVRADVPGAVVYLDDRRQGALPRRVEASVGPHILRVEAPGHHAWARLFTVLEGDRLPVVVTLSPEPALREARRALAAAQRGQVEEVERRLARVPALSLSLLFPSRTQDRALRLRCGATGCGEAERLAADTTLEGSTALGDGLRWLERAPGPVVSDDPPWWERWEFWTAIAGGVVLGVLTGVALAQPQGEPPLVVVVDPTGL